MIIARTVIEVLLRAYLAGSEFLSRTLRLVVTAAIALSLTEVVIVSFSSNRISCTFEIIGGKQIGGRRVMTVETRTLVFLLLLVVLRWMWSFAIGMIFLRSFVATSRR